MWTRIPGAQRFVFCTHGPSTVLIFISQQLRKIETRNPDAMEAITITESIQSLPPELFNMIFNLVFTAVEDELGIDDDYRPSKLLSISRASRAFFAKSYYGRAARIIGSVYSTRPAKPWLKSLPPDHLIMLKEVRFRYQYRAQLLSSSDLERIIQGTKSCCTETHYDLEDDILAGSPELEIIRGLLCVEAYVIDVQGALHLVRG